MFLKNFKHTLEMVKFSHSIFALPFALSSLFFAVGGWPDWSLFLLVVLCMIFARNTAMAFNRVVDAKIDAKNPRTALRHLPAGLLSKKFVVLFTVMNALAFVVTTYFLNSLAFRLSPLVLATLCFYSFTKRFTHATQIFLGLSLALAPVGAWIAVKETMEAFPLLLGGGVLFWVAGFDIIYATQDYDFDRSKKLKSLVVWLGIQRALVLSRIFHVLGLSFFLAAGIHIQVHTYYLAALVMMAFFLAYEHLIIKPNDLSRVHSAFFTLNGVVGILFLMGSILEVVVKRL